MSPERAFNIVLNAAVLQWAANTKQGELREALDRVLGQLGDDTLRRALSLRWNRTVSQAGWPPMMGGDHEQLDHV